MIKRIFDICVSSVGLLCLWPIFLLSAIAIKASSKGPIFFRQERVGLYGQVFLIHKFRTMIDNAEAVGGQLTTQDDFRVTRVGRFLRRHKLDELPQLIDVLLGRMSLVGPRPEVPRYVDLYPAETRNIVLSVRPGITDASSIMFRDESALLGNVVDTEAEYLEKILPRKLELCIDYVNNRSLMGDIKILLLTLRAIA